MWQLLLTILLVQIACAQRPICGLLANSLLLAKTPTGVSMGWMLVLSTPASTGVGGWQTRLLVAHVGQATPQAAGVVAGAVVAMTVRLFLLGLYVAALVRFSAWLHRRDAGQTRQQS